MTSTNPPRVRIAPSPTGDPHIGTAYTGLFNYVFARKSGGKFIVRIEDTDRTRYRKESENMILDSLRWFGLSWDEGPDVGGAFGPYRQSERLELYRQHSEELISKGQAYRCFCPPERLAEIRKKAEQMKLSNIGYDRHCRELDPAEVQRKLSEGARSVIRLKVPLSGSTTFRDRLRGEVTFENAQLDDLVLLKADGYPTYHLANVVDDHAMKITHVIRGEEWVSSTPKHVLLYQAFGWEMPEFIHLNLLRNPDKSKVSKRRNPTSVLYYRRKGIVPAALRNFLALMGWNPGQDKEIFSTEEMIANFSWEHFNLGGPVFDLTKLLWMNGQYLKQMPDREWVEWLRSEYLSEKHLLRIVPLVKEKIEAFEEFFPRAITFFSGDYSYDSLPLVPKDSTAKEAAKWLSDILESLESLDEWTLAGIQAIIEAYQKTSGLKTKTLYMTLRIAVTGSTVSPALFETMDVLGRQMVSRRLRLAIQYLKTAKIS